ncbi:M50 family metallopeptidase [Anabaena sp. FACHB-1237]|uniref:M50 family metallopeptidase n=1 Tax=Anabaena sp. FACHB-1237 TaxID=2692769 RepID=UPI00168014DF|nr:M50 family metallopeptidase [Anabaena sp. FACHB-1237]MBD2137223.1 M50 family metallopeptidase [Anabaena sp. FACHB-1237]
MKEVNQEIAKDREKMSLRWLIVAAIATVVLWQIPFGNYILYPFTILATWFHEMGHGLMALILGGHFHKLEIFSNGSGLAHYALNSTWGNIGPGLVAAAGPMGPPIAGSWLITASGSFNLSTWSLKVLGGVLLLSTLVWVRSLFGFLVIPILGLIILGIALKTSKKIQGFAMQFLGVQACVSTYHQVDYLFSYSAGGLGLSDTAQMQRYLFLPYWFWGGLMTIASLFILVQSLRIAYTEKHNY